VQGLVRVAQHGYDCPHANVHILLLLQMISHYRRGQAVLLVIN